MSNVATARPSARRVKTRWAGLWFTIPFLAVFTFVLILPLLYALYLSLFQNRLVGGNTFVGLDNFARVFTDPLFWEGLGRVSVFFVIQVPIMLLLSLVAALVLDSVRLRGTSFFRIAIFLPFAVPSVVAALLWGFMYGEQFGLVGNINDAFGTEIAVMTQDWFLAAIGNIATWGALGYNMLILYSSLKSIPPELYEAAALDGASSWRVAWNIKLPYLRGAAVIALIFSVIGSFHLFNEPNLLKTLVPNLVSTYYTPNMYAYNLSFVGQQTNYAATITIVMGIVTAIIAYVVQLRGNKEALQ